MLKFVSQVYSGTPRIIFSYLYEKEGVMKIKLKKKKLTTGKYSLYIEYYKGKIRDENGKQTHIRQFEYIKRTNPFNSKSRICSG